MATTRRASKAAPKKATAPVEETPRVSETPKRTEPVVEHLLDGAGCACGWYPNYDHVISVGVQQQRHFERNRPDGIGA